MSLLEHDDVTWAATFADGPLSDPDTTERCFHGACPPAIVVGPDRSGRGDGWLIVATGEPTKPVRASQLHYRLADTPIPPERRSDPGHATYRLVVDDA